MSMPSLADVIIPHPRIPRATYRLQFHAGFTFRDAREIVPYLDALGISDIYASPILFARPGSQHGYDVCDPSRLNPELGTPEDFAELVAELHARGMGILLDTVPNHMGIHTAANAWWMDVLENGPSSIYAHYFDIDWQPIKQEIANKVLLPILGDHYGQELERGALQLVFDQPGVGGSGTNPVPGAFWLMIDDGLRLPIAPQTYRTILHYCLDVMRSQLGGIHPDVQELESILTALDHLPPPETQDLPSIALRYREKEVTKRRIAQLAAHSQAMRLALDQTVHAFNGVSGDQSSFDRLDDLIAEQSYRPAFWRVAADEINYRRFFDINQLAAIQVEHDEVFTATHRLIFELLARGDISGLRIDHPDGLWDPARYFRQLQDRFVTDQAERWVKAHETGDQPNLELRALVRDVLASWRVGLQAHHDETRDWPLYIVVEKILSEREPLPADWPVFGTTGYDFLNGVNDLFVARENERAFTRLYQDFTIHQPSFAAVALSSKRLIMNKALSSELNALSHQLERITERNRRYRDYTLQSVDTALREVILYLQIYRTYTAPADLTAEDGRSPADSKADSHGLAFADGKTVVTPLPIVSERDQHYITAAVNEARRQHTPIPSGLYDFLEDTLLLRNILQFREEDRQRVIDFVMKFQQVTGPIMAKSLEDTAFYSYHRLVALNEVGGNPEQFGASVGVFHEQNAARWREWPHALLATSTHDTKRSEDVRARIDVLSEMPQEWEAAVSRWHAFTLGAKQEAEGMEIPSRNDELLLYQTLIGIWPFQAPEAQALADLHARVTAYMRKAVQEAKTNSSWINPNDPYLVALDAYVAALLDPAPENAFLADFQPFARHVAYFGQFNALSQTLLKLASPGVPDFYQGTELWGDALVDPDNRRPVDYGRRRAALTTLIAGSGEGGRRESEECRELCAQLLVAAADGCLKLYTIAQALELRRRKEQLFAEGTYRSLEARGEFWQHCCAFARQWGETSAIAVTPRLLCKLQSGDERPPLGEATWHDTWLTLPDDLAGRTYRDVFTGSRLRVGERDGVPCLAVAELLSAFPVALLEQV